MKKIQIIMDDETRPVWEACLRARDEVAAWPAWKRGDDVPGGVRPPVSDVRLPEIGAPIRKP